MGFPTQEHIEAVTRRQKRKRKTQECRQQPNGPARQGGPPGCLTSEHLCQEQRSCQLKMSSPSLQSSSPPPPPSPTTSATSAALGISAEAGDGHLFPGVCGESSLSSPLPLDSALRGRGQVSSSLHPLIEEIKPNIW